MLTLLNMILRGLWEIPDIDEEALDRIQTEGKEEEVDIKFGELVVLGFSEYNVDSSLWAPTGRRNKIFPLCKQEIPTGFSHCSYPVTNGRRVKVVGERKERGKEEEEKEDVSEHFYSPSLAKDQFQIGRMNNELNDLIVRGPLHKDRNGLLCGPVSRYAARIECDRFAPFKSRILAGGFDKYGKIQLSSSCPQVGEGDGCTTFGIRVFLPSINRWVEVSVLGKGLESRTRSDPPGDIIMDSVELEDGSIIDLAGIQVIFLI